MGEERKLVTVLFADIVGSTAFGANTDPEVVRQRLSGVFSQMRSVLESHGATVEKFIGDAVMAVFGIPRAHDDDAERAVRAAFALSRIATLNDSSQVPLELRIGIESGQVVVGVDGSETLVTGLPVNSAARLQQAAAVGEILVGSVTRRLAEGSVAYGDDRVVAGKGLGEFVAHPARALTSDLPEKHRGLAGMRAPLIGRADELQLLIDSHHRAASERRAYLVTLFGGAGVGKSRLVSEFIEAVGPESVRRGRCLSYGDGITYWPVREILRTDIGIGDGDARDAAIAKLRATVLGVFGSASDDADAIARRLTVLAGIAPIDEALPDVDPSSVAQELRWGFRRYFERRAGNGPVTLIFDDLHWAEPALLDLVEYVAEWSRAPVVLLCAARPELRERRPAWGGGLLNAAAIGLDPLTIDESARLVRELLSVETLSDELRTQVISRSGGNPLFVEELLRMLVDAGHLDQRAGNWFAPTRLESLLLPPTLRGIIAARLDQVPQATKRVLQRASVVGKVFWTDAVQAQGDLDESVDALFLDAARRDLVSELDERGPAGGRAFTFKHILIRDVAYEAIPKRERYHLHDRYGRWLERTSAGRPSEYSEIVAYHSEQAFLLAHELGEAHAAELGPRALEHLLSAGRAARRRAETPAAYALYSRALAVANSFDAPRALWLEALAFAVVAQEGVEPGGETDAALKSALTELRRAGPSEGLVAALTVLAAKTSDNDVATSRELYAEALAAAEAVGDPELVASQMLHLHWPDWIEGRLDDQLVQLEAALAFARAHGITPVMSRCLAWLTTTATLQGNLAAAREYVGMAEDIAADGASILTRHYMHYGRWNVERYAGDLAAAERTARAGIALAKEIGVPFRLGTCRWWLADVLFERGAHAESRAEYERSLENLPVATSPGFRAETLAQAVLPCIAMGDVEAANRYAEEASALVSSNDVFTVASTRRAIAEVRAAQGRSDEAEHAFREAIAALDGTGYSLARAIIKRAYGRFLAGCGRRDEAKAELEPARVFFDSQVMPYERDKTEAILRGV
jgi:class 3 adenylate cyclase/tetratricopeptide (TPR) repeat protein